MAVLHRLYRTDFCGQLHRLSDGMPVDHECFRIPPALLDAEVAGQVWRGIVFERWKRTRQKVRGVKPGKGREWAPHSRQPS